MKVTIITAVLNGENYIADCIDSVLGQDYTDIEYIIVDGASTDGTLGLVEAYADRLCFFLSEKDNGFYDALNKGIRLATGEIIGQLNSDDVLADPYVISRIVKQFKAENCEAVYGNLNYTRRDHLNVVIRRWWSGSFSIKSFEWGWMPPHPALYLKKELFKRYGVYDLGYGSCSDYELMLRLFYTYRTKAVFINELFVKMRAGGTSNIGWRQFLQAFVQDYRALSDHAIPYPFMAVCMKKFRKITQFLGSHRKDIIRNI